MKLRSYYLVVTLIVVVALSGCSSSNKATSQLLSHAHLAMERITSIQASMDMNVKMKLANEEIHSVTQANVTAFVNPTKMKVDVTSNMSDGQTQDLVMQMYMQEVDSKMITYANAGTGWIGSEEEKDNLGQYQIYDNIMQYLVAIENPKGAVPAKIGNVTTVRVEGLLTGDVMKKAIIDSGILSSVQSVGLSEEDLEAMLTQIGGIPITLWIGQDGLIYQYQMNMTELMQIIMDKTIELLGMEQANVDSRIIVEEASIQMQCLAFNEVEDFEIPQEALLVEIK